MDMLFLLSAQAVLPHKLFWIILWRKIANIFEGKDQVLRYKWSEK